MKKELGRKILCMCLIFSMVIGLCACGKDGEEGESSKKKEVSQDMSLAKQYVYSYENIELPTAGKDVQYRNIYKKDDVIYFIVEEYINNVPGLSCSDVNLMSMNADGSKPQMIILEDTESEIVLKEQAQKLEDNGVYPGMDGGAIPEVLGDPEAKVEVLDSATESEMLAEESMPFTGYESISFNNIVFSKGDLLYAVKNYWREDYSDESNPVSENITTLCAWNLEGKLQWESALDGLQTEGEDSYVWIRTMVAEEDGSVTLLVACDEENYKVNVDPQGTEGAKQNLPKLSEASDTIGNIIYDAEDGVLYTERYDEHGSYFTTYDYKADIFGEKLELPISLMSGYGSLVAAKNYDFILTDTMGVLGYNLGDEEPVRVMDFVNSDLHVSTLSNIMEISETQFMAFYFDESDQTQKLASFTKRNPEDIPDKKVLVMGGDWIPYELMNQVFAFNKENEEYRITVKDYSVYNTAEDYEGALKQLNNDIITGKMPDILCVRDGMPMESYMSKGLLADVGALIAKDEELSKVEFMENVFDAYKFEDKLYYVIPNFTVESMIGKKAILGDRTGWNMQEFLQFATNLEEGQSIMAEISRESFIRDMFNFAGREFVDVSTGTCKFDSEQFVSMLEYAKTLPSEIDMEYEESYWDTYNSQYRENRTILMHTYIDSFQNMAINLNGMFGEDVVYVGFPTEDKNGAVVCAREKRYAISAKSENIDGAWEFLRYFMTKEAQEKTTWSLPIRKDVLMEKSKEAMQKPYYIDEESGEKVEYDNYFEVNGEQIILEPLNQQQLDQVIAAISSANKSLYSNEELLNIITEESAAFFEGQKNAKDVAQIIQSRAQIYVDENR